MDWLEVHQGSEPVILTLPHTGTELPDEIESTLVDPWLARKDTDWWIDELYAFAKELDVTVVRSSISRTVVDLNRDPSGSSLYPGQATTELCPTTTFDGEPLYLKGQEPDAQEIERRKLAYFWPYHQAIAQEIERVRSSQYKVVVLYDAHSIRSVIPRLFEGELPHFNIGTDDGKTCDRWLRQHIEEHCDDLPFSSVTNGRFRGGWTVRHHGHAGSATQAVQMELAMRSYLDEPGEVNPANWPPSYSAERAQPMISVLHSIFDTLINSLTT